MEKYLLYRMHALTRLSKSRSKEEMLLVRSFLNKTPNVGFRELYFANRGRVKNLK